VITERLVRAFVRQPDDVESASVRGSYGVLEGATSIVVNLIVFVVKLVPGIMIGSISLIADAVHSLGDVASSVVVIWGFKVAAKPSDREHPFGHGRGESVAALVIGVMLFVVVWEIAQNSVLRLLRPTPVRASELLLVVLAATLVVKEWLSRFALALGRRIQSNALEADGLHHRSDVFATAVVIGSLIAARFGFHRVDAVGGLAVAGFIAVLAFRLTNDAISPLLGEAPPQELIEEIRAVALGVPGVDGLNDVTVHSYGGLLVSSLRIEVRSELGLDQSHEVAEAVEGSIDRRFKGWTVVHVDPVNPNHPLYPQVHSFLAETVGSITGAASFRDLRIVGAAAPCHIIFDLSADGDRAPAVASQLQRAVLKKFPDVSRVVVNVRGRRAL
jgi:cation diffusion facilitator family transporter